MVEAGKLALVIFSLLVLIGGVMGFVKAKSKASLIAGVISAALLDVCWGLSLNDPKTGLLAGDVVTVLLLIMFIFRLRKSGKFMPSGLMVILSAINSAILTYALLNVV